jgi:endonuclease III
VSPIEEEENPSYDLAKLEGPGRLGSPPELLKAILAMPGLGPYAAANVMQCLGEYDVVAADSETARHLREVMLSFVLKTLLDVDDWIQANEEHIVLQSVDLLCAPDLIGFFIIDGL